MSGELIYGINIEIVKSREVFHSIQEKVFLTLTCGYPLMKKIYKNLKPLFFFEESLFFSNQNKIFFLLEGKLNFFANFQIIFFFFTFK